MIQATDAIMKLLLATITCFSITFFLLLRHAHAQNPTLQTLSAAFEAAEAEKNHAVIVSRPSLPQELDFYSPQAAEFLFHHGIIPSFDDDKILFENAARWWGVKYRWGGLSKTGVDCQGLVRNVVDSTYGISLPAGAGSQYLMCTPIRNKAELQPGDLVFFKIGGGYISHVGLYLKNNKFIHTTTCCGVVVSDLNDYYYRLWYFSGGRLPFDIAERRPEPVVCAPVLSPFVPENEPESMPDIEACRETFPWQWALTLPFLNR